MMVIRPLFLSCATLWLMLLAGCGQSGPAMAPVSGTVTFNGKPLSDAQVMFAPRSGGRPALGRTDQQGCFQLTTLHANDGALVGDHAVTIAKFATKAPSSSGASPNSAGILNVQAVRQSLIPERYSSENTSGLNATVVSGKNTFSLELTTAMGRKSK